MKQTIFAAAGFAAILATVPTFADAGPRESEITAHIRRFLDAYSTGDQATVLLELSPDVRVYGSDISETFRGIAGVRQMMDVDLKLWGGLAKIGPMQNESIACAPTLCATTFEAPFSLHGAAPIMVRFSMAWRRTVRGWRLVQSANSTPTVGQSGEALLRR